MSLSYDTTILDHLAEYFLYLSAAPSFWFVINSSYDHEFHLSRRFGMSPDDYECIMVAAKLAEFHKTRGYWLLTMTNTVSERSCNNQLEIEGETNQIGGGGAYYLIGG